MKTNKLYTSINEFKRSLNKSEMIKENTNVFRVLYEIEDFEADLHLDENLPFEVEETGYGADTEDGYMLTMVATGVQAKSQEEANNLVISKYETGAIRESKRNKKENFDDEVNIDTYSISGKSIIYEDTKDQTNLPNINLLNKTYDNIDKFIKDLNTETGKRFPKTQFIIDESNNDIILVGFSNKRYKIITDIKVKDEKGKIVKDLHKIADFLNVTL